MFSRFESRDKNERVNMHSTECSISILFLYYPHVFYVKKILIHKNQHSIFPNHIYYFILFFKGLYRLAQSAAVLCNSGNAGYTMTVSNDDFPKYPIIININKIIRWNVTKCRGRYKQFCSRIYISLRPISGVLSKAITGAR